jgi:transcriptional regulator of acetoin/glycerol metabolism
VVPSHGKAKNEVAVLFLPRKLLTDIFGRIRYRLNVFAIHLPACVIARDDMLPLSEAFLTEIGRGLGRVPGGISREARWLLLDYHWPGNVRERCTQPGTLAARVRVNWPTRLSCSEDVAHCERGYVVRRLNSMLDLKSKRLPEGRRTKWQVTIAVEQDGRITTLSGTVINANAADDLWHQRRLTAETEPRVGDAAGVKASESGKKRDATANVMCDDGGRKLSPRISDKGVTTDGCQAPSAVRLQERAFGTCFELEARSIRERDRELACERKRRGCKPAVDLRRT